MKTTKKKRAPARMGRPADPFPGRYQVRHNEDQLAAWLAAAGVDKPGAVLQHWIRNTLDKEAARARR